MIFSSFHSVPCFLLWLLEKNYVIVLFLCLVFCIVYWFGSGCYRLFPNDFQTSIGYCTLFESFIVGQFISILLLYPSGVLDFYPCSSYLYQYIILPFKNSTFYFLLFCIIQSKDFQILFDLMYSLKENKIFNLNDLNLIEALDSSEFKECVR